MRFSKWHGLGNDYLLLERADVGAALEPRLVRRLCDRHTGIGSDGVLEVVSAEGARAEIVIWNPDGTTAELSGNGTRIAARWLAREGGWQEVRIVVGPREVVARTRDGFLVETEMGRVHVSPVEQLELGGDRIELTPVSIGNPHAVVRGEPDRGELHRLGPLIENHPRFPERTNVQLARVDGSHQLSVAIWERGAGETLSSGTGACAAAAAAIANGWCESPVTVLVPGGELAVTIDSRWEAVLTGPAQEVCSGEVSAELLAEMERRYTATP